MNVADRKEPVEAFLQRLDPYHISYPFTPLPRPTNVDSNIRESDKDFAKVFDQCSAAIFAVLRQYKIPVIGEVVATRQWRHEEISRQRTVTVHSLDTTPENNWVKATKEIYDLFYHQDLRDIQIETVNPDRLHCTEISSDLPSEENRVEFQEKRDQVRSLLDTHMHGLWRDFNLYMCMNDSKDNSEDLYELVPTIVIHVEDHS